MLAKSIKVLFNTFSSSYEEGTNIWPTVYLHFLNFEIRKAYDKDISEDEALRYISYILIFTNAEFFSSFDQLFFIEDKKVADVLSDLSKFNLLKSYSVWNSKDEFIQSRERFFNHVPKKLKRYVNNYDNVAKKFGEPNFWTNDTTKDIETDLLRYAKKIRSGSPEVYRLITEGLKSRGEHAITIQWFNHLFLSDTRNKLALTEINQLIQFFYIRSYLAYHRGRLVTGIPNMERLDYTNKDLHIPYDFTLTQKIFNKFFSKQLLNSIIEIGSADYNFVFRELRGTPQHLLMTSRLRSFCQMLYGKHRVSGDRPLERLRGDISTDLDTYLVNEQNRHFNTINLESIEYVSAVINESMTKLENINKTNTEMNPSPQNNLEETVDLFVITVIGEELDAVKRVLGVDNYKDRFIRSGLLVWKKKRYLENFDTEVNIHLHCIGKQANEESAISVTKYLSKYDPRFIILLGIGAGRKGKVKIGDTVYSRSIVSTTVTARAEGKTLNNPTITDLNTIAAQMLNSFKVSNDEFHEVFRNYYDKAIVIPKDNEDYYKENVILNDDPRVKDATISSQDVLVKDPNFIEEQTEIHRSIVAAEMEGSGVLKAIEHHKNRIPWIVIRGISDLGDQYKNDLFHEMASISAASFLRIFIDKGFDKNLLYGKH